MHPLLKKIYDVESFRQEAHAAVDRLANHVQACQQGEQETIPPLNTEQAVALWGDAIAEPGADPNEMTMEDSLERILQNSVQLHSPYYMGHQIAVPALPTVVTALVTDALNNGCGVFEMGKPAVVMERILIALLSRTFGFTEEGDPAAGFFTSGGSLANLTALLAARAKLPVELRPQTNRLAIMVSEQAHYCAGKAAAIMGLPAENVIRVPADCNFSMDVSKLTDLHRNALASGKHIFAIVGSACTTSTGSFDDLRAIAAFASEHNIWLHVDGAHGAAVAFSERHRELLDGIQLADSVTIDFHKMMMVPALCSALVFRDAADSFRTFETEADYLFAKENRTFDESCLAQRTFECTKNMMVAKAFAIYQEHGSAAWAANIDHLHMLTQKLADLLGRSAGFEVACVPQTNIICYRYQSQADSPLSHCEQMRAVRERIVSAGNFYIVSTKIKGETWLRSTISNPFTSEKHFVQLCGAIRQASAALADVDNS